MKKGKKTTSPWPLWMGIRGFRFVYHGDWADPELVWHKHLMNVHSVEDPMWELYAEQCREDETETTEEDFARFCSKNAELAREFAQETINCGCAERVRGLRMELSLFSQDSPYVRVCPAIS